jgi:hypothetical protein
MIVAPGFKHRGSSTSQDPRRLRPQPPGGSHRPRDPWLPSRSRRRRAPLDSVSVGNARATSCDEFQLRGSVAVATCSASPGPLADEVVAVAVSQDQIHVGEFVAANDGELRRVAPHLLVVARRNREHLSAALVFALADDLEARSYPPTLIVETWRNEPVKALTERRPRNNQWPYLPVNTFRGGSVPGTCAARCRPSHPRAIPPTSSAAGWPRREAASHTGPTPAISRAAKRTSSPTTGRRRVECGDASPARYP